MERLLHTFDAPFRDREGDDYDIHVYGRNRPGDTWQAWLVFKRRRDGRSVATDMETTQPSPETILYWATGLEPAYFDGAFDRAVSLTRAS